MGLRLKHGKQNYKTPEKNVNSIDHGNAVLPTTAKMWPMKERVAKLDLSKLKFFCFAKFNAKKMKKTGHRL